MNWSRADESSSDSARVLRDGGDVNLANTPTARKEAKQKAKARSKAAEQTARTRKLNRQEEQATDRQAAVRQQSVNDSIKTFFAKIRASMAVQNEKKRAETNKTNVIGSFRRLLKQVFPRD